MSYQALAKKFEDIYYFDRALSVLRWDTQTHMPSAALKSRYKTIAVLENYKKEILTSTKTREEMRLALQEKLGEVEAKNLSLMQEELDLALIIPSDLQEKLLEVQAEAED